MKRIYDTVANDRLFDIFFRFFISLIVVCNKMLRILTSLGSSRTFRLSKSSYRSFSGVKAEKPRPEVPKEQESSFTVPLSFLTKDFIDLCGGKAKLEKKTTNQIYDDFLKPKLTPTIRSLQDIITSPLPTTSAASPVYYIHHDPNTPFLETIDQLTNYFNDIDHESIQLLIDPFTNRLNQPEISLQEILTTNKQIITNYQNQLRTLILIPSNYSLIPLLSNRNFIFHLLQQTILKISNDKKQFLFPLKSTLQPYEILLQWEKEDLNFSNYLHLQKIIIQSLISDETLLTQPLTPPKPSFFPQQTPDEKLLLLKKFDDETSILFQFIQKEWQIPYSSLQSLYEKNIQQILLTSLRRHYTSTATHPIALLEGKLFLSQVEDLLPTQSPSSNEAIRGGSSSGDSKSKSQKYMIQIKDLHYSVERLGKSHPLTQQLYLHHFPVVLQESQGLSEVEKYYNTFLLPILTSSSSLSSPPATDNMTSTRTVYPTQKVILALHEYGRCITERNLYIKKIPLLERYDWIEKYYHTLFTYIIPKLGQEHHDTMILIYSYLDYYHVLMNQYEESLLQNKGKSSSSPSKKASNNNNSNKKDLKTGPKSPPSPTTPTLPTSAEVEKLLLHLVKQMKEFYRDLPVSAAMIDSLLLLAKYYHLTANSSLPHKGSHKNKSPLPEKTIKIIDLILSNLDATLSQKQRISNYTFDSLMNVLNYLIAEGTMPCYEKAELLNWKILPLINHGQHLVEAVEAFSEISISIDDINHEKLQSGGGEGVSALPQGSEYPALFPYHKIPVIPVEEVVAFLQERDRAHEEEERRKNGGQEVEKNPLHSVLNMIGRAYYQQGDYMMARQYFIAYKGELEDYKAQISTMIQAEEGPGEEKEEDNDEEEQEDNSKGKNKEKKEVKPLKENQKKESFLSTEQLNELKELLKELNFFLDHITISIFSSSIQLKDITTAHKDEFFHAYHHIKNQKMIKKEEYAISITLNRYFADCAIYYQQYKEAYYFLDALYYLQSDYKNVKDHNKYRIIDYSNTCNSLGDVCYKLKDYKKSMMFYEEALGLYEEIFGRKEEEEGEVEAVIKVKQMIEVVKKEIQEKKTINQKKQ